MFDNNNTIIYKCAFNIINVRQIYLSCCQMYIFRSYKILTKDVLYVIQISRTVVKTTTPQN